jgi:hypothetical protein
MMRPTAHVDEVVRVFSCSGGRKTIEESVISELLPLDFGPKV